MNAAGPLKCVDFRDDIESVRGYGPFAKRLRQRIANPPSPVRIREGPFTDRKAGEPGGEVGGQRLAGSRPAWKQTASFHLAFPTMLLSPSAFATRLPCRQVGSVTQESHALFLLCYTGIKRCRYTAHTIVPETRWRARGLSSPEQPRLCVRCLPRRGLSSPARLLLLGLDPRQKVRAYLPPAGSTMRESPQPLSGKNRTYDSSSRSHAATHPPPGVPAGACADSDAFLLDRFIRRGDEAVFAVLVDRYGRLVLSDCRRVLGDVGAAEDCTQAAFLVLARKAATIRGAEELPAWLHGTAYRLALRCRRANLRRLHRETHSVRMNRPTRRPTLWMNSPPANCSGYSTRNCTPARGLSSAADPLRSGGAEPGTA